MNDRRRHTQSISTLIELKDLARQQLRRDCELLRDLRDNHQGVVESAAKVLEGQRAELLSMLGATSSLDVDNLNFHRRYLDWAEQDLELAQVRLTTVCEQVAHAEAALHSSHVEIRALERLLDRKRQSCASDDRRRSYSAADDAELSRNVRRGELAAN